MIGLMRCAAVVAVATLIAVSARAQSFFTDCRSLHEICQDAAKYPASGQACRGYISGALDQLLADHKGEFCLPKGTSASQIQEAVTAWLAEHTEQGHLSGASCVLIAVTKSYSCNKK
jgi:hypothetical protein